MHVSFDGGGRWTQTAIPAPAGEEPKCFAPDAAFSSDGTLYVSYVTLKGRANSPNAVWISRSSDGGKTLSPPVRTPLGKNAFQVRMTADPTRSEADLPDVAEGRRARALHLREHRQPDHGDPLG